MSDEILTEAEKQKIATDALNAWDGERHSSLALAPGSAATDTELASHMNALMDELKWFYSHRVIIHLSPNPTGWNLKFTVPDEPNKD